MLSHTASDAVIVSLRRSLNWANTVTRPVRLTARLARIEGLTQTRSSPIGLPTCAAKSVIAGRRPLTGSASGAVSADVQRLRR
jgi:hypothetical protein